MAGTIATTTVVRYMPPARHGQPHGSGLGKTRWVVERTISWLRNFLRLRLRIESIAFIHEAFLKLACCIICWRQLQTSLC
jgi:transposase